MTIGRAERFSERTVLDEQTRPSAGDSEAAGTVGSSGAALGAHLVQVHDYYRAELARVRNTLHQVRAGVEGIGAARAHVNAMTIRANDWTLGGICQGYCRAVTEHHTLEGSAVFPHLRRSSDALAPVLERLDEEHLAIHGVLEEVDAALIHLVQNPSDYSRLIAAVDLLSDTLLSHFAYEESELVGPLGRYGLYPGQV